MLHGFIWYELLTSDPDAAAKFYGNVIGWTCTDSGQTGMDYRQFRMSDAYIGGLMKIPTDAAAAGMRPAWLGYIHVADVDQSVASIVDSGGVLHMPAMSLPGVGRLAMVADPQGAAFYVISPTGQGQSTSFSRGKPGHGGWHELHAKDQDAAFAFYAKHFGWSTERVLDMGPMGAYRIFDDGRGEGVGGMMTDPHVPRPNWVYCFNVSDIVDAATRVSASGGSVVFGPVEVPGGEWIVSAKDPQGAAFVLVGEPRNKII